MYKDYGTDEIEAASPDSIFRAQRKPSEKALEGLREWRDSECQDDWSREALDSAIKWLETEVKQ